jgi:hypothetical protein
MGHAYFWKKQANTGALVKMAGPMLSSSDVLCTSQENEQVKKKSGEVVQVGGHELQVAFLMFWDRCEHGI